MTNKDYLITVFEALAPQWDVANYLLNILKSAEHLSDDLLDGLTKIVKSQIQSLKDEKLKGKLNATLAFMEDLKKKEHLSQLQDEQELKSLEAIIASA